MKTELAEYNKRKLEREAKERRAARAHRVPYDKKREALEELEAISHPNEEQEQHGGRTHSKLPARIASHEQEAQSQRRSAFERLRPNGSQNREKRRDHTQSNQFGHPREERSRASYHSSPRFVPKLNDSWQEGGAELEHREARTHDRFPCFFKAACFSTTASQVQAVKPLQI
jgi:hypothetical protein